MTKHHSPVRTLIIIALSVFFVEGLVMLIFSFFPPLSPISEGLLDSALLVVLLSPALYFFLFRPLVGHITERRRAEEELLTEKGKLESIVEGIGAGFSILDSEARITWANETLQEWFGPIEEIRGKPCYELYQHEDIEKECAALRTLESGEIEQGEAFAYTVGGEKKSFQLAAAPVKDADGNIVQMVKLTQDVTERKRAEEELRERSEFLVSTIESLNHPFYVIDPNDFTIKLANSATHTMFGSFPENATCYAVTHRRSEPCGGPNNPCPVEEVKKSKKAVMVEHIHYDKDGNPRNVEVHCHPIFDNEGNVVQAIEYTLDITERKRAEEALEGAHDELKEAYDTLEQAQATAIASEKLAALGRLTAGVSHEILNPLNFITLCVQMLLDDPDINPELAGHLRNIEEHTNRIVKITQGLLSFSRQHPPERRPIELNDILTKALGLLEYDLKLQNITVEFKLAEGLPSIMADENQLHQVVLNLITNARDVMPKGGRLVLTTAGVELVFEDEERAVEFKVEDTGPGIPPENLDKLFEPFFTTKPEGEGTGLGLSVCQGIIEAHGGAIWAENVPEGGAVFIIRLSEGREDAKQNIGS